jgi:hypothetical protein
MPLLAPMKRGGNFLAKLRQEDEEDKDDFDALTRELAVQSRARYVVSFWCCFCFLCLSRLSMFLVGCFRCVCGVGRDWVD